MREIESKINNETPTRYIKHLEDSTDIKCVTLNKHYNGLIRNRFETPDVSYTHRYMTFRSFLKELFLRVFVAKEILKYKSLYVSITK